MLGFRQDRAFADLVVAGARFNEDLGSPATDSVCEAVAHGRLGVASDVGEQVLLDRAPGDFREVKRLGLVAQDLDRSFEEGHLVV